MSLLDTVTLVSSGFSVITALPLIYLAVHAQRDSRDLRLIQGSSPG